MKLVAFTAILFLSGCCVRGMHHYSQVSSPEQIKIQKVS